MSLTAGLPGAQGGSKGMVEYGVNRIIPSLWYEYSYRKDR